VTRISHQSRSTSKSLSSSQA